MSRLRTYRDSIAAALAAFYILVVTTMMPAPVVLLCAFGVDISGAGLCGSYQCGSVTTLAEDDQPSVLEQLWAGACGVDPIDTLPAASADNDVPRERPDTCPYSSLRVIAAMCSLAIDGDAPVYTHVDEYCGRIDATHDKAEGRSFDVDLPPPKA